MSRRKEQIVVLAEPAVKYGLDGLRMIRNTSRARVIEDLLGRAVRDALAGESQGVQRIHALAKRAGMSWNAYVSAYAAVYQRLTYAPSLADLEADDRAVTGQRQRPVPIKHPVPQDGDTRGAA